MKITRLKTYLVAPRWLFLKIETDEGLFGWGEPTLEGHAKTMAAKIGELEAHLIGRDPLLIEDIWQSIYRHGCYRGGPVLMSAISGIDMALWDIKGKFHDAPVHALLGGQVRNTIRRLGRQKTILLSTHILPEVQSVCDRVQIINRGRLVLNESIEQMREKLQATSLLVALRTMPSISELESIAGVASAELVGDGRVRINYAATLDPSDAIVEQAVANGWGLYELTPERMTLEQVFVDITSSDALAHGESGASGKPAEQGSEGEAA